MSEDKPELTEEEIHYRKTKWGQEAIPPEEWAAMQQQLDNAERWKAWAVLGVTSRAQRRAAERAIAKERARGR